MPKTPPPSSRPNKVSKDRRRSRPRSRSSSSRCADSRRRDEVCASIPRGINPPEVTSNLKRVRGIGRGKAREAKAPLLAPTSSLSGTTMPKEGLRITIPAGSNTRIVEVIPAYPANVEYLAKLESKASSRWDLTEPTTIGPDFVVKLPQEDLQEDSDIDLRTGEIKNPDPWREPIRFTYRSRSVLEDHQRFAEEVLRQEPKLWDCHQVENNPSLFYQAYFLDQQKISDVRSKGTLKI